MEEEEVKTPNVIIDNGTLYIKAGFSGEHGPRSVFRSLVINTKVKSKKMVLKKKYITLETRQKKRNIPMQEC